MTTQVVKRAIPAPRDKPNFATASALYVAVNELSGAVGVPTQRALRVCELLDAGILKLDTSGVAVANGDILIAPKGVLKKSITLDYRGDSTSVFGVLSPGTAGALSSITLTSPGGSPGITALENTGKRRDITFTDAGITFGASTTGALPAQQLQLLENGDLFLSGGRLFGSLLHNNPGGAEGTTNQYIASGTYTPTLTAIANVSGLVASTIQYLRVGNVVIAGGRFDVTVTTGGTLSQVGVSLPIASNLLLSANLSGAGYRNGTLVGLGADTVNNRANLAFQSPVADTNAVFFLFMYLVL